MVSKEMPVGRVKKGFGFQMHERSMDEKTSMYQALQASGETRMGAPQTQRPKVATQDGLK